jgi:hypothetical protein
MLDVIVVMHAGYAGLICWFPMLVMLTVLAVYPCYAAWPCFLRWLDLLGSYASWIC